MALAGAASVFTPYLDLLASPNVRKVKITNIKCVRTKIGFRPSLLVKVETDAGIIGIGECHHDENSMGGKDIVLNVIKPILVGQYPYDLGGSQCPRFFIGLVWMYFSFAWQLLLHTTFSLGQYSCCNSNQQVCLSTVPVEWLSSST